MTRPIFYSYRFLNTTQLLSVFNLIINQPHTGCLEVFSGSESWSIYIEDSKLIYACSSNKMFEMVYSKLQKISQKIADIYGGAYQKITASFSGRIENGQIANTDYLTISWLVKNKLISDIQAGIIVGELAVEVLQSLLRAAEEGSYQFTPDNFLDNMPTFCHLDIKSLIVKCQSPLINQQNVNLPVILEHTFQGISQNIQQTETLEKPLSITENSNDRIIESSNLESSEIIGQNRKEISNLPSPQKLRKVVCIDDSPAVLTVIKSFLDEEFFSVTCITDPLKAFMRVIRTKPDIILLDITMPHLDGYQFCSLLRKHSDFKKTPVIMVTAKNGFIDKARAKMVRASGYLSKPFAQEELLKIMCKHIND
ncbi:MAG: response regulator [Nostocaceae cyanobacterium]|nr:response regulator [Nostocaceae cyanobacterium]